MCSLDGRSGTNTGAIPSEEKRASLEGSLISAVEGNPLATPPLNTGRSIEGRERKEGLAIPCARATRGRRLPSLDARTLGNRQATPPIPECENKKETYM
jgi:hypothetical protein